MKINWCARIIAFIAALASQLLLSSCAGAEPLGPSEEEILARLKEIVPTSQQLNEIFVGKGLEPTEKAVKSEYNIGPEYFVVAEDAPYRDIASLKAAAESVYSKDYLKSVYIMAFEGHQESNITPRYKEVNGILHVDINYKALDLRTELDLSSAKVVESTSSKVKIKINYTLRGTDESGTMTLVMVHQDGVWLLDGPTF
jgi:hypothetical protein